MWLITYLIKNEERTKSMILEAKIPRTISLRTLLQKRRASQSLLITQDIIPFEVKS